MSSSLEAVQYSDTTKIYHINYVRNSRAVGVMWGIFTICYAIINIVVFIQPQWLGDNDGSTGTGYFGLYRWCRLNTDSGALVCEGKFADFDSILSATWKAAAFLVGFSALLILICICCMLLFLFLRTGLVFHICAWIQVVSGLCMFVGCILYPVGWDSDQVRSVCGPKAGDPLFSRGDCSIRWAYVLAILGIFDAFVLAALAFVLATRQAKLLPDSYYATPSDGSIHKSDLGNGYPESEKVSNMQPVMTVPDTDRERYSDYSTSRMSKRGEDFAL